MPHERYQGVGEAGVTNPIPKEKYFELLNDDVLEVVVNHSCDIFGVNHPLRLTQLNSGTGRWHGMYKIDTQDIQFSHTYLGLILHETSHHIYRRLYPTATRHVHHDGEFYRIVQELHDLWR